MPLEINEIGIRMFVRSSSGGATADDKPDEDDVGCNKGEQGGSPGGRDAMIEECVRRVLRALKKQQER